MSGNVLPFLYNTLSNALSSLGSDDNQFLEVYPNADRSMANLLKEIRLKTRLGRSSKNGTPDERASVPRSGSVMTE
jgi:hypothetical protein